MIEKVISANKDVNSTQIREIFWEYLQWANAKVNEEFSVNFDIGAMLTADMQNLDKFMPPKGSLLLCYGEERLAGIACLKYLAPKIGEIQRMYVRPDYRKGGLGRALINLLVADATEIGYERVRLSSARFMKEAQHLYKITGFTEIKAYEGNEIPKEFQKHWIFMEMELREQKSRRSSEFFLAL